jgi:hypothetical protein
MLRRLGGQEGIQFASKLRHCKPNSHRTGNFVELLDAKQALFLTGRKISEDTNLKEIDTLQDLGVDG